MFKIIWIHDILLTVFHQNKKFYTNFILPNLNETVIKRFHNFINFIVGFHHNKLLATDQNFLFKSCKIWNTLAKDVLEKNKINCSLGYVIPGEEANSDLSAFVVFIEYRLTKMRKQSSSLDEIWEKSHLKI